RIDDAAKSFADRLGGHVLGVGETREHGDGGRFDPAGELALERIAAIPKAAGIAGEGGALAGQLVDTAQQVALALDLAHSKLAENDGGRDPEDRLRPDAGEVGEMVLADVLLG